MTPTSTDSTRHPGGPSDTGLDAILYLLGISAGELQAVTAEFG